MKSFVTTVTFEKEKSPITHYFASDLDAQAWVREFVLRGRAGECPNVESYVMDHRVVKVKEILNASR